MRPLASEEVDREDKMDVVKRKRSKGGFFNLFDWPGKSRKKLFSNSSEISEESRQGREKNVQNSSKSQLSAFEVDETGRSSIYNPRSDSSCCASSVTSDDGQVARAPSVVARLMGLESLPVPNASDPRFNQDLDPFFLRCKNPGCVILCGDDGTVPWEDHSASRMIKGNNRPIQRFQTETLPPRSAKPISVTHNRLLSPIRNPGFVPSKNPAYVMEAASRMIEPSPRVVTRTRFSSIGSSSSVPLRIQDLKEKLEAAQKAPTRQFSNDIHDRGKHNEKRSMVSHTKPGTSKISGKGVSDGLKGKVKPSSQSAQAKAGIQRQDDSKPSNGIKRTSSIAKKASAEAMNRIVKSQNGGRGSSLNTGKTVLKQNNQKQNCRDRHQAARVTVPNQQSKKVMNKVVSKVLVESEIGSSPKKSGSPPSLAGKEISLPVSQKKNLRKQKPPDGVQEVRIANDVQIRRAEKSVKRNIAIQKDLISGKDEQKKDMDVISFTFSSPIKGISSTRGTERDTDSVVSFNVIGGDSLNDLLEQKLRELTSKIESSSCSLIREESLVSVAKDGINVVISSPSKSEVSTQNGTDKGLSESESLDESRTFQVMRSKEHEISSINTVSDADDPGLSCSRSCSDCRDHTAYGMKQSSSDVELTWVGAHREEEVTEFAESVATLTKFLEAEERLLNWETDYITEILSTDQLMLKEFALGMAEDVLPLSIFHETDIHGDDPTTKIDRNFGCVTPVLNNTGSCRGFVGKHGILFERRDWLAEELNREIQGLKKMREKMVDELVDNDMSKSEGRWLDYEKEAYEEGIEVEREIVSALVDDLVDDLLSVF
ncbi:PREDICTED: uncharacterized protein LOC104818745 [Tarenaya hassleriana]|uniref:uncharacterized protein LOC104818745 n=1 Tax=Tarenaya hassleriana TaxID=28532 RepID=UPI00053C9BBC|nr:PREDICTED: uncharacterized protein LOC104818745 [Tarenaya hassleriana]